MFEEIMAEAKQQQAQADVEALRQEINKIVSEALDAYSNNDNDTVGCILDYLQVKTGA